MTWPVRESYWLSRICSTFSYIRWGSEAHSALRWVALWGLDSAQLRAGCCCSARGPWGPMPPHTPLVSEFPLQYALPICRPPPRLVNAPPCQPRAPDPMGSRAAPYSHPPSRPTLLNPTRKCQSEKKLGPGWILCKRGNCQSETKKLSKSSPGQILTGLKIVTLKPGNCQNFANKLKVRHGNCQTAKWKLSNFFLTTSRKHFDSKAKLSKFRKTFF